MPRPSQSAERRDADRATVEAVVLYVEGPRDRDILRAWARGISPAAGRLVREAVILGGRQPHRAAEHFRSVRATVSRARGLCVLDRDHAAGSERGVEEPGLEFFTWGRRHIESYLLVPDTLRRAVRTPTERFRLERALRDHLPDPGDEPALRAMDAKRLLGSDGIVSRALGRTLATGRIARAMRHDEIHPDVHDLLGRIEGVLRGV